MLYTMYIVYDRAWVRVPYSVRHMEFDVVGMSVAIHYRVIIGAI